MRTGISLTVFMSLGCLAPSASALTFDIAGGLHQQAIVVENKNNRPQDGAMVSKLVPTYQLSLRSRERYFGDSNWGFTLVTAASHATLHYQKDPQTGQPVDLGTHMDYTYLIFTPTWFYRWGQRFTDRPHNDGAITLGLGYGVGYSSIKGDIILNNTGGQRLAVDAHGIGTSLAILFEMEAAQWFYSVSGEGITRNFKTQSSEYRVQSMDIRVMIGRRFSF